MTTHAVSIKQSFFPQVIRLLNYRYSKNFKLLAIFSVPIKKYPPNIYSFTT